METLVLPKIVQVSSSLIAPVLRYDLGQGIEDTRRRLSRPLYQWTVQSSHVERDEFEYLWSFARFHQFDRAFFYAGEGYNEIQETPAIVGVSDGVRTQYLLPFRRPIPATWEVFSTPPGGAAVPVAGFTIVEAGGVLILAAAEPADRVISAKGQGIFLCKFFGDEELNSREEFKQNLFTHGITIREVAGVG